MNEIEKYCPRCKEIKKRVFWRKNKNRYDGLQAYCRECQEVIYRDNPEKILKRHRDRYRNSPEERERVSARAKIRDIKKAEERTRVAREQYEKSLEEWKRQLPNDVLERYGFQRETKCRQTIR